MTAAHHEIRRAVISDIPGWLSLARGRYPGMDLSGVEKWVEWCIQSPKRLVLVGNATAGVAGLDLWHGIALRAQLIAMFTVPERQPGMEPVAMLRIMVAWARENKAKPPFLIDAQTGVDFGPFAARLGGHPAKEPRYVIPF